MANGPDLIEFASREAMAARIADLLEARLADGGELAVSGGSTPQALYKNLAARSLDWNKVCATLVDERWVDINHPRSNEAFALKAFAAADEVSITGLFNGAASPHEAIEPVAARLEERGKPFDAVVLGMGGDGHTASWFPHARGLDEALTSKASVCAIEAKPSDVTGEEVDRMTLTLSAIKDARLIVLLLAGAAKRAAFEKACEPGPIEDMPVRAILRTRPDMWVCWAP